MAIMVSESENKNHNLNHIHSYVSSKLITENNATVSQHYNINLVVLPKQRYFTRQHAPAESANDQNV